MKMPTEEEIAAARHEIEAEDKAYRARIREYDPVVAENNRRSQLPSEHPDHIHGMMCDGQDGMNSYCVRLRIKLFG